MRRPLSRALFALPALLISGLLSGCAPSTEVSTSDTELNKQAFSQEAYEKAMIEQGKGAELEAEKARAAAREGAAQDGQP